MEQSKPIGVLFDVIRRMQLKDDHHRVLAFAQTCTEIRHESLALFYSLNTFQVNICTLGETQQCRVAFVRLCQFLKSVDTTLVSKLNIVADVVRFFPCSGSVAGLKWELLYGLYAVSQRLKQYFRCKCVFKFDGEYLDELTRDVYWINFSYDWIDWEHTRQVMLMYTAERPEYVTKSVCGRMFRAGLIVGGMGVGLIGSSDGFVEDLCWWSNIMHDGCKSITVILMITQSS